MSANRVSSELAQNERLYNVEATNNVHVGGKRVRGFKLVQIVPIKMWGEKFISAHVLHLPIGFLSL